MAATHGLSSCASWALDTGSLVGVHGLVCFATQGTLPDQGPNPLSPALAGGLFVTEPPGKANNYKSSTQLEDKLALSIF